MNSLLCAFLLYSRIPTPFEVKCDDAALSRAITFFPLVGAVVGAIGAGACWCANQLFGASVAIIIAIFSMTFSTGALHEDGFADFCDGFGGGYDKAAILRIMKDSFIGCYGVIGLIAIFLLRYFLLSQTEIEGYNLTYIFIAAHSASRFGSVAMIRLSNYARENSDNSRAAHSALGISLPRVALAFIFAFAAPTAFFGLQFTLIYLAIASIAFALFKLYIERHIEGFTGDTLGALQVICELLFYATLLINFNALWQ